MTTGKSKARKPASLSDVWAKLNNRQAESFDEGMNLMEPAVRALVKYALDSADWHKPMEDFEGKENPMTDKPTKAWIITYTDDCDRSRRESWRTYAFDARHAEEKFYDSDNGEGWEFISVDRPRTIRGLVDTRFDKVSR